MIELIVTQLKLTMPMIHIISIATIEKIITKSSSPAASNDNASIKITAKNIPFIPNVSLVSLL